MIFTPPMGVFELFPATHTGILRDMTSEADAKGEEAAGSIWDEISDAGDGADEANTFEPKNTGFDGSKNWNTGLLSLLLTARLSTSWLL